MSVLLKSLVSIALLAGCALDPATAERSSATGPAPTNAQARYEIRFMTDMIDHHQMAVMMGMICLDKAGLHAELHALCEGIIATQSAEIETMQAWLAAWYGIDHEPAMNPGMMRRLEKLASLPPAAFEIEFMEDMIRHHASAVREGRRCVDRAYHEPLIELCERIVEAQLAEIELMQSWLCEWYDDCA